MKGYFRKRNDKWSFTVDLGKDPLTRKRRQKTKSGFKTKKEAQNACAELITLLEKGTYVENSKQSFGEFILSYLENHYKQTVRSTTFDRQYTLAKLHVIPSLGHLSFNQLSVSQIQELYRSKLEEGLSITYVKKIHAFIRFTLNKAYEWELIAKDLSSQITLPRIEKKKSRCGPLNKVNNF
ncbi:MAG TPA: Arm DNA-binding domain-containing protein [Bacillus sp. (in: firmicutes)]|nr:Arm DNA-binding domain-containing protein [Bacillus sp. (in: firmicutes)]